MTQYTHKCLPAGMHRGMGGIFMPAAGACAQAMHGKEAVQALPQCAAGACRLSAAVPHILTHDPPSKPSPKTHTHNQEHNTCRAMHCGIHCWWHTRTHADTRSKLHVIDTSILPVCGWAHSNAACQAVASRQPLGRALHQSLQGRPPSHAPVAAMVCAMACHVEYTTSHHITPCHIT